MIAAPILLVVLVLLNVLQYAAICDAEATLE